MVKEQLQPTTSSVARNELPKSSQFDFINEHLNEYEIGITIIIK